MAGNESGKMSLAELRMQAEARLRPQAEHLPDLSPEAVSKLVQELRTHEIELELQNEELRRAQDEIIVSRDRYSDLYDFAPVGYATLSRKGLIFEANLTLADMLGVGRESLLKQRFSAFVVAEDEDVLYLHYRALRDSRHRQTCELRIRARGGEPFWAKLESTVASSRDADDFQLRTAVTDISVVKQAEQELAAHRDHLEELVASRTDELTEANGQLRRSLDLYERDRKLAAYEIHDGFIQPLTAAKMHLEGQLRVVGERCPDVVGQEFRTAVLLLDDSLREARQLMNRQRPEVLDEFGLLAAIEHLVLENRKRNDIDIVFSHEVQFDRLAAPLETAIFRIVQEGLVNAWRHSKSDKVCVALTQQDGSIRLDIEDWGIGFDPMSVEKGRFGLEGLHQRAHLFGGCTMVNSSPGNGTHITVVLPVLEP